MPRNFLLCRDLKSSSKVQKELKILGQKSSIYPLFKIDFLDYNFNDDIKNIIITSQNVFFSKDISFWQKNFFDKNLYLIGESLVDYCTKNNILYKKYFSNITDLINSLDKSKKYLYLRGRDITEELKEKFIYLEEIICYQANYKLPNNDVFIDFLEKEKITDILFFSSYSSKNFLKIFKNNKSFLSSYNFYCLSSKIADYFTEEIADNRIFIAKEPNLHSMLELIKDSCKIIN